MRTPRGNLAEDSPGAGSQHSGEGSRGLEAGSRGLVEGSRGSEDKRAVEGNLAADIQAAERIPVEGREEAEQTLEN